MTRKKKNPNKFLLNDIKNKIKQSELFQETKTHSGTEGKPVGTKQMREKDEKINFLHVIGLNTSAERVPMLDIACAEKAGVR